MSDREALAIYGLKRLTAHYALKLYGGIEAGWPADAFQIDVENFAANLGTEVTFEDLVEAGRGARCHDCDMDTGPCDEDGYPVEGWEGYMVKSDVWDAAVPDDPHDMSVLLCVGCLEGRLGRRLGPEDFTAVGINEPGPLDSPRLRDRRDLPAAEGS
jgi:hypothetical protein